MMLMMMIFLSLIMTNMCSTLVHLIATSIRTRPIHKSPDTVFSPSALVFAPQAQKYSPKHLLSYIHEAATRMGNPAKLKS